jgi:hypothetical protein
MEIEKEVRNQIFNLRQTPDFLVFKGPCISSKIGRSYRKMCIYELREEKLAAANEFFDKKFLSLSKFPGFDYDLKPLSKLDGALTRIGGL